jgi:hypothetical protein
LPDISNPRALEFSVLSDEFKKYLPAADIIKAGDIKDAFSFIGEGETAGIVGSLYLAGQALEVLGG